jgi:endonuclease/exonuclease/phosphatase (EEP) superfamily protein YafD
VVSVTGSTTVAPAENSKPWRGHTVLVIVFAVLAVLFVVMAAMRLFGLDGNRHTAALLALSPYGTVAGMALGIVALTQRHWWIGVGVLAVSLALIVTLVPRLVPARPPAAPGRELRIMSSNLYLGRADAKTIVRLVREHDVDVLNLLELTPEEIENLDQAGLCEVLPHRVFEPAPGGAGSGIASRFPLSPLSLAGPSLLAQPSARVDLGSGASVEVVAAHPIPPTTSASTWKKEIAGLPAPAEGVRILAGDFNATLDHATFRRLLSAGYADAGERRGAGFTPTWPARFFPPPVTIDHVLVDARVAVADYRVFAVPHSDHHAVYARLTLP